MAKVVPFVPMEEGYTGPSMKALRRAISRSTKGKLLTWVGLRFSPHWGKNFTKTWIKYQRDVLKVPVTKKYDKKSHQVLVNKFPKAYDPFAIKYLLPAPLTKEQKARNSMLANLMYFYNNRMNISYKQWRPYKKVRLGGVLPTYGDCSGSGAGCAWGTNGLIPNFNGYPWGYGNTWSQVDWFQQHGKRVQVSQLKIGDSVQFHGHVGWVVGWQDGKPIIFSFGSYPVRILPYDYRTDFVGFFSIY